MVWWQRAGNCQSIGIDHHDSASRCGSIRPQFEGRFRQNINALALGLIVSAV
jgi:hypothetical protein